MKSVTYEEYKSMVDGDLAFFLPKIDEMSATIEEAMKYSLLSEGKRLRPVLLLAACDFAGGNTAEAMPFACAVEYIHTYSLIHDDLPSLDNDDLRRGRPTNHKVFGDGMALLAGDGLLSCAFEAINKDLLMYLDDHDKLCRHVRASYELIKSAGCRGMVAGQVADVEAEGMSCAPELLKYIHLNKTAALITGAVRAGATIGGADEKMMKDLTLYAESLGLAFQIADDILDVEGDAAVLGKNTGVDSICEKATYPCIYGLDASHDKLEELTGRATDALADYYDNAEFFVKLAHDLLKRKK